MRSTFRFLTVTVLISAMHSSAQTAVTTATIRGSLTRTDHKQLFEREFNVSAGTKQLKVSLEYTGDERRTVIDLGLRGPAGFRGWSGGGPQTIVVGPTFASYGYLPGPIESGRWAVVLGVPNIREGSKENYSITIEQIDQEQPLFPIIRRDAGWFAGDFHAHSGHSDGRAQLVDGSRVKIPPHRIFDAARAAGLDFIALTDHNTSSHWTDVERLQPYYSGLLLLHAREVTTYNGHLNAFGERTFVDFRVRIGRPLNNILDQLHSGGAFVSVNHPAIPDDENCMGCGWAITDTETMRRINGIEVVNGIAAEGPTAGWPVWVRMLNAGFHLTAIGGSDEHSADESNDRTIGTPTTVVYARELSEPALLEGLRKGNVYVRTRGPAGPDIQFEAISGNMRWQMGDTIPSSVRDLTLSALSRSTGQRLEWIRNGELVSRTVLPAGQPTTQSVQAHAGDWFSVTLRDDVGPTLFSNAIYVSK